MPEEDTTQLLMHWFDKGTRTWAHLPGGTVKQGALVTSIAPKVLRSQGFSGLLANMLVNDPVVGAGAGCSEFETLINGKCQSKRCLYYASLDEYQAGCVDESHCLISKALVVP